MIRFVIPKLCLDLFIMCDAKYKEKINTEKNTKKEVVGRPHANECEIEQFSHTR